MEEKYEEEIRLFLSEREKLLQDRKNEVENRLNEMENKFKYAKDKEEISELKEARLDSKKISDEVKNSEVESKEIKEVFENKEKIEKEIEKLNKTKESLLKDREECKKEINSNGAGKKEALADMLKIDTELKETEKVLKSNTTLIKEYEAKINEFAKKYNIEKRIQKKEQQQDKEKDDGKENDNGTEKDNKIENNKKDIEKLKRMMDKYKNDPEKCKDFQREIDRLEKENKELQGKSESENNRKSPIMTFDNKKIGSSIVPPERRIEQKVPKERPLLSFDVKTGKYLYRDENGKTQYFDFYMKSKDKEGKYESVINRKQKKDIEKYAIGLGVPKKYAKMIDANIYAVLNRVNEDLRDKYIESFKQGEEFDKGFDLVYDFKKKDKKTERDIGRKNIRELKRKALKQEKLGIATVLKDKTKTKAYAILAALGIAGTAAVALNSGKDDNKQPQQTQEIDDEKDISEDNVLADDAEKNDTQKENEQNTEMHSGDYVTIRGGSMVYSDPTDKIRMSNGENANETVQVKPESTSDRLYKITMEGYYSPDGSYISVKEGEKIEEALKAKGLDESFLEREDTIKMYHTVANGIAQWVSADDVEKCQEKVDKFGNRIEKTEEEKAVDEAAENYMKDYNRVQEDNEQQK